MSAYKQTEQGVLYDEQTVVRPYTGTIDYWAGQVIGFAKAEPEREFALLFNGRYLPVSADDTVAGVCSRYWFADGAQ